MTTLVDVAPALAWTRAGGIDDRILDTAFRARRFARSILQPGAVALDRRLEVEHGYFPWDLVRAGAREGWLTAGVPTAWGGHGLSVTAMSVAMEEMCAADAGAANIFGAHGLGLLPLMLSMDLDLGRRVLGPVVRATTRRFPLLCAFAITEPGGGSDVQEADGLRLGDVQSHAVRVRGGYRLTGRKVFISNGSVAEYIVVFVALDRTERQASWTGFVIRHGAAGVHPTRVERKMGQRACPAAEITFEDVFVPDAWRVGREGEGWELTRRTLAVSRGPVGAIAVGIARDAYECALTYLRDTRPNGGRRHLEPWMEDTLAGMAVRIRTARAAYLEAGQHCDEILPGRLAHDAAAALARAPVLGPRVVGALARNRRPGTAEAWAHQCVLGATAKIAGSDTAMKVTTEALDLIPVSAGPLRARAEKAFRDAKLTQIYEGTNQINLRAITHESWQRSAAEPVWRDPTFPPTRPVA
jgi:alkylation response protein AidB-like acyl-CoA dehydrogenase